MLEHFETPLRIAVAQSTVRQDPTNASLLRDSGAEVRHLMKQAAGAGARLVHFTEGAICLPGKRVMSSLGTGEIGPSDWAKAEWNVLREELDRIATLSRELGIWTVIPSVHQLVAPSRPHNSIYVVSDQGKIVAVRRTHAVDNEDHLDVRPRHATDDLRCRRISFWPLAQAGRTLCGTLYAVRSARGRRLLSYATTGLGKEPVPIQARGYAATNTYWISLAAPVPANPASNVVSGVIDPHGNWAVEGPADSKPTIVATDLHRVEVSRTGRDFRRRTRARIGG